MLSYVPLLSFYLCCPATLDRMLAGRQTLENAIEMVNSNPDWQARVVYGDTDSLFVLLPVSCVCNSSVWFSYA